MLDVGFLRQFKYQSYVKGWSLKVPSNQKDSIGFVGAGLLRRDFSLFCQVDIEWKGV